MGGEKVPLFPKTSLLLGSPPRGRGKGICIHLGKVCEGITPAWAGKSNVLVSKKLVPEDHPRVGGEKATINALVAADWGITPAWAGKSCDGIHGIKAPKDHPRVGGEKTPSTYLVMAL